MSRKNIEESRRILDEIKTRIKARTWGEVAEKIGVPRGTCDSWRSKGGLDEDAIYKAFPDINLEFLKTLKGKAFLSHKEQESKISTATECEPSEFGPTTIGEPSATYQHEYRFVHDLKHPHTDFDEELMRRAIRKAVEFTTTDVERVAMGFYYDYLDIKYGDTPPGKNIPPAIQASKG